MFPKRQCASTAVGLPAVVRAAPVKKNFDARPNTTTDGGTTPGDGSVPEAGSLALASLASLALTGPGWVQQRQRRHRR